MKRFFAVVCVFLPLLVVAQTQTNYEIFKIEGSVSLHRKGINSWENPSPLMGVSIYDTISLAKGGSISILEKNTGRIFISTEIGSMSVGERLKKSEQNNGRLFKTLNNKIIKSLRKENKSHKPYVANAATSRGDTPSQTVNYDLYDSVSASILQYGVQGNGYNFNDIIVTKEILDNGTFGIKVKNNCNRLLFFNLMRVHGNDIQQCFYLDNMDLIPLPSGKDLDLTPFTLYDNGERYIFFALETNLYLEILKEYFKNPANLQAPNVRGLKIIIL